MSRRTKITVVTMKSTSLGIGLRKAVLGLLSRGSAAWWERGSATVEFALTLPVFLVLGSGMISFGHTQNQYVQLINGTASGAQFLSGRRSNTTNPCQDAAQVIYNATPYLNQSDLTLTYILDGTTYGPYTGNAANTCSSTSTSSGAAGDLVYGQSVRIMATYPCTLSIYGLNVIPGCTLHTQVTEIVQ